MSGLLFFIILCSCPLFIFAALVYGDYKQEGKLPWKKKRDNGVNSGAKFG